MYKSLKDPNCLFPLTTGYPSSCILWTAAIPVQWLQATFLKLNSAIPQGVHIFLPSSSSNYIDCIEIKVVVEGVCLKVDDRTQIPIQSTGNSLSIFEIQQKIERHTLHEDGSP